MNEIEKKKIEKNKNKLIKLKQKNKFGKENRITKLEDEFKNNKEITVEIMREKSKIIENIVSNISKNYITKQELDNYMFNFKEKNNSIIDSKSDIIFGLIEKLSDEISEMKKEKTYIDNQKNNKILKKMKIKMMLKKIIK